MCSRSCFSAAFFCLCSFRHFFSITVLLTKTETHVSVLDTSREGCRDVSCTEMSKLDYFFEVLFCYGFFRDCAHAGVFYFITALLAGTGKAKKCGFPCQQGSSQKTIGRNERRHDKKPYHENIPSSKTKQSNKQAHQKISKHHQNELWNQRRTLRNKGSVETRRNKCKNSALRATASDGRSAGQCSFSATQSYNTPLRRTLACITAVAHSFAEPVAGVRRFNSEFFFGSARYICTIENPSALARLQWCRTVCCNFPSIWPFQAE